MIEREQEQVRTSDLCARTTGASADDPQDTIPQPANTSRREEQADDPRKLSPLIQVVLGTVTSGARKLVITMDSWHTEE